MADDTTEQQKLANDDSFDKIKLDPKLSERELQVEINAFQSKYRNRRRMAWISLAAIFIVVGILLTPLVPETRVKELSTIIDTFLWVMAAVIGSYMGFTTLASVFRK